MRNPIESLYRGVHFAVAAVITISFPVFGMTIVSIVLGQSMLLTLVLLVCSIADIWALCSIIKTYKAIKNSYKKAEKTLLEAADHIKDCPYCIGELSDL